MVTKHLLSKWNGEDDLSTYSSWHKATCRQMLPNATVELVYRGLFIGFIIITGNDTHARVYSIFLKPFWSKSNHQIWRRYETHTSASSVGNGVYGKRRWNKTMYHSTILFSFSKRYASHLSPISTTKLCVSYYGTSTSWLNSRNRHKGGWDRKCCWNGNRHQSSIDRTRLGGWWSDIAYQPRRR